MSDHEANRNTQKFQKLDGSRLFLLLQGHWSLERTVSDGSRFSGRAEFLPLSDKSLLLTESGKMLLGNGDVLNASRQWVWQIAEGPQEACDVRLNIHYPAAHGGGLYHRLCLIGENNQLTASDTHLCGKDQYRGQYSIGENSIMIEHIITGPKKDMEVLARFYRF